MTSRRDVLKTAALGGAIWSTPAIRSVSRLAADGSTKPEPTTSSTAAPVCSCEFTATTTGAIFTCTASNPEDCDCLCVCGGDRQFPCANPDPCSILVECVPVGGAPDAPIYMTARAAAYGVR